jgi:hypothetical protein
MPQFALHSIAHLRATTAPQFDTRFQSSTLEPNTNKCKRMISSARFRLCKLGRQRLVVGVAMQGIAAAKRRRTADSEAAGLGGKAPRFRYSAWFTRSCSRSVATACRTYM